VIAEQLTRTRGVGHSRADDAQVAGRESVAAALAGRVPEPGDLVLIFPSASYDVDALHRAATAAAGAASVVGCTTCGAFTDAAQVPRGCTAAFVPADGARFGVAHVDRDDADIAGSARRAAEQARDLAGESHPHSALLMFSDGLAADQREVARGAYEVTGAVVPLVGGAAGDDLAWQRTHTFGAGAARANGLVAVWLNSPRPIGVSVDHGWRPYGRPMLVTRAEGNVILELDGQPACEVYLSECGARHDPHGESLLKTVLEHPLGLPNANGGYDVRQVVDRLPTGGLIFNTGMPEHTVVQVMATDEQSLLGGARRAAAAAVAQLGDSPRIALIFSCASRVPLLGDRLADEAAAISAGLDGAPACGYFTCGEFARVPGSTGVHNSSVAVLAL
jgi:hypothetical protein